MLVNTVSKQEHQMQASAFSTDGHCINPMSPRRSKSCSQYKSHCTVWLDCWRKLGRLERKVDGVARWELSAQLTVTPTGVPPSLHTATTPTPTSGVKLWSNSSNEQKHKCQMISLGPRGHVKTTFSILSVVTRHPCPDPSFSSSPAAPLTHGHGHGGQISNTTSFLFPISQSRTSLV